MAVSYKEELRNIITILMLIKKKFNSFDHLNFNNFIIF